MAVLSVENSAFALNGKTTVPSVLLFVVQIMHTPLAQLGCQYYNIGTSADNFRGIYVFFISFLRISEGIEKTRF